MGGRGGGILVSVHMHVYICTMIIQNNNNNAQGEAQYPQ